MKKNLIYCFVAIIIATIISISSPLFFYANKEYIISVKKDQSITHITSKLFNDKIISYPIFFKIANKITHIIKPNTKLYIGDFKITKNMHYYQIIELIHSSKYYYSQITFPEGLTKIEMLEILNNSNIAGEISVDIQEGELYPETYKYTHFTTKNDIIKKMKENTENILNEAWKNNTNNQIKSKQELLIFASIVEKETNVKSEAGLVASVFTNRLEKGIKLQSDPTIIYEITDGKTNFRRKITKQDIQTGNRYNTYKIYGLPPTPICSPSKTSILASANPEKTDYLYFVAIGDNSGKHNFSTNLSQHNEYVIEYRTRLINNQSQ